tara:strand:+ start:551 stop:1000 length:450 start_codon:yes stop_codon:yes gene_type:complete
MKIDIDLKFAPSDLKEIYSVVCQMYNIDIRIKSRKQNFVFARALFYSLSSRLTKHSYVLISGFLKQDHSSCVHAIKTFDYLMATEEKFREAARFALFKSCDLLEKIEEEPRDFIFLNWSKITNKQQSEMKDQMVYFLNTNAQIKNPNYA